MKETYKHITFNDAEKIHINRTLFERVGILGYKCNYQGCGEIVGKSDQNLQMGHYFRKHRAKYNEIIQEFKANKLNTIDKFIKPN